MVPTSGEMTTTSPILQAWDTKPAGKAARIALAVLGTSMGTLLLVASVIGAGPWAWALVGVALAAVSVRAARVPSLSRLAAVAITLMVIPLLQVF
jgi:hypothetical protein